MGIELRSQKLSLIERRRYLRSKSQLLPSVAKLKASTQSE